MSRPADAIPRGLAAALAAAALAMAARQVPEQLIIGANAAKGDALLATVPFLMTHNSGTGFIGSGDYFNRRTKQNQYVNLVRQLTCGVRALDMRLHADGDDPRRVVYHHASYRTRQTTHETLPELVAWCQDHPGELVLIYLSHCSVKGGKSDGDQDCLKPVYTTAFRENGIPVMEEAWGRRLESVTLDQARKLAKLPKGGMMLALTGGMGENYDRHVGTQKQLESYVDRTMRSNRGTTSHMWILQGFLQQSATSHWWDVGLSKVPGDGRINKILLDKVKSGYLEGVNMLEVNFACAYGPEIAMAFGANITSHDRKKCHADCEPSCKKRKYCPALPSQ